MISGRRRLRRRLCSSSTLFLCFIFNNTERWICQYILQLSFFVAYIHPFDNGTQFFYPSYRLLRWLLSLIGYLFVLSLSHGGNIRGKFVELKVLFSPIWSVFIRQIPLILPTFFRQICKVLSAPSPRTCCAMLIFLLWSILERCSHSLSHLGRETMTSLSSCTYYRWNPSWPLLYRKEFGCLRKLCLQGSGLVTPE